MKTYENRSTIDTQTTPNYTVRRLAAGALLGAGLVGVFAATEGVHAFINAATSEKAVISVDVTAQNTDKDTIGLKVDNAINEALTAKDIDPNFVNYDQSNAATPNAVADGEVLHVQVTENDFGISSVHVTHE